LASDIKAYYFPPGLAFIIYYRIMK